MAYVLRYSWQVQEVGPNGNGMNAAVGIQGAVGPPNGQRLAFFQDGSPASQTFTSTDIANMVAAVAADMTAQLTAQIARIQGFASGGG
jgi:hypothetical protein